MPDQMINTVVGEAEVETAPTDVEAPVAVRQKSDTDRGGGVVPVPVEPPARPPAAKRPEPEPAADAPAAPATDAPATSARPAHDRMGRALRFLLSWPAPLVRRLPTQAYRLVDAALWALNRPFAWLRPEARQLIGLSAIVTIIMSLLALGVLPLLFPARDALWQFRAKSAEVRHTSAVKAEPAHQ